MASLPISLETINEMREAQFQLQCEGSMNVVESFYRERQFTKLQKKFNEMMITHKKHYLEMLDILKTSTLNENSLTLITSGPPKEMQADIPKLFELANFAFSNNLTDFFTFSTLPSYFTFFLTEFQQQEFERFFKGLNDDMYDLFARVAFASPFFIEFATRVFQPIFSEVIRQSVVTDPSQLVSQIQNLCLQNGRFLPWHVRHVIFHSNDAARTLSRSFFEVALSSPRAAQFYGLFHYSHSVTKELLTELRKYFYISLEKSFYGLRKSITKNENHILLEVFSALVNASSSKININNSSDGAKSQNSNDFAFPLFDRENKEEVSLLFQPLLLSLDDLAVFDFFNQKTSTLIKIDKVSFFKVTNINEAQEKCYHNSLEMTMLGNTIDYVPIIRHLLQNCDTIPLFKKVPEGMTYGNFFGNYLVKKGPMNTYSKRCELASKIFGTNNVESTFAFSQNSSQKDFDKKSFDEKLFLKCLRNTSLDRTKEIKALSAFSLIHNKIDDLTKSLEMIFIVTKFGSDYALLEIEKEQKKLKNMHKTEEYSKDLDRFFQDLRDYTSKLECTIPYVSKLKFAFSKLTYHLTYTSLQKLRKEYNYAKIDKRLHRKIPRYLNKFLEENLQIDPSKKFDKKKHIRDILLNIKTDRPDLILLLNDAINEDSIIRKVYQFSRLFSEFVYELAKGLPPGAIGLDEALPAGSAFLMIMNPPALFSNFALLMDYAGNSDYSEIFDGDSWSTCKSCMRAIIEYVLPDLEMEKILLNPY
ncbi:hypothetical protein TRFO_08267 [Tritrichomonas foetus]|uniref:Uncharacterized protein n=1 Tax=Tritrichomonas foetus TaxID=1144522 RepID=A0A1J4JKI6_9EUKA|nr:hypothetical protein TRFO_08267 [Tritrichomonas foetus]|eukprot:OHS99648.1 hypothetical protein TRFO_08267 [Tritrichomonas foetus]